MGTKRTCVILAAIQVAVLMIFGLFLLSYGIYLLVEDPVEEYGPIMLGFNNICRSLSIGTTCGHGGLLFLLSILGICRISSCRYDVNALKVSFCVITVLFVIQFTAGILFVVYDHEFRRFLTANMYDQVIEDFSEEGNEELTEAWNDLQDDVACCGCYGYGDWSQSAFYNNTNLVIPYSCCVDYDPDFPDKPLNACISEALSDDPEFTHFYGIGCYTKVNDWFSGNAAAFYGVVFCVASLELCFAVLAFVRLRVLASDDDDEDPRIMFT